MATIVTVAASVALISSSPRAADRLFRNVMIAAPEWNAAYGPDSVTMPGERIVNVSENVQAAGQVIDGKASCHRRRSSNRKLPPPSADLIKRLSAAAHQRGLKIILRAHSQTAHEGGPRIDIITHGLWNWREDGAEDAHRKDLRPASSTRDNMVITVQPPAR